MAERAVTHLKFSQLLAVILLTINFLFIDTMFAEAQEIEVLNVEITTEDHFAARTKDDVELVLLIRDSHDPQAIPEPHHYRFYNDGDLFKRGEVNAFRLTEDLPAYRCEILSITVRKIVTGLEGSWRLGGLLIYINDDRLQVVYENSSINHRMYDDENDWSPSNYPVPEADDCPIINSFAPHSTPSDCTVTRMPPPGSGDLPEILEDSDCDGIPDREDSDPDIPANDSDRDGIPDPREEIMGTDPNNPDTDGDGIPDSYEDIDRDGIVDPGETDPTVVNPGGNTDSDGDGAPDWYEIYTNPNDADSDDDNWSDGPTNIRTFLLLQRIECEDEEEDVGHDEFFLVVDDVRFPQDIDDIDGRYQLERGGVVHPNIVVAQRVRPFSGTADYTAVVETWEDDSSDNRDDYWQTDIIHFSEGTGQLVLDINHDDGDAIYHITFLVYSIPFSDPDPLSGTSDSDADGLQDAEEYDLSVELNGLSDPAFPDIFIEMDWVGEQQQPEAWSKRNVVSQFYYHGFLTHLDDGDFQRLNPSYGGENLSYGNPMYFHFGDGTPSAELIVREHHFADNRQGRFHYIIAVDEIADGYWGLSQSPTINDDGEIVCTSTDPRVGLALVRSDYMDWSDMESILMMHELGHSFGLCHRPEDPHHPLVVPAPVCVGTSHLDCAVCLDCSHYWIEQSSDTAMRSGFRPNRAGAGSGLFIGIIVGVAIGLVASGGNPIGAFIGGTIGALVGFFVGGWAGEVIDVLDCEINYETAEWAALKLSSIRLW